MDHVVYLDFKSKELEALLNNQKSMIIRGAAWRKLPYGRVKKNDNLYFVNNNWEWIIKAKAKVSDVILSDKMDQPTSKQFVSQYQDKLCLSDKQFERRAGKRYIVLIQVEKVQAITPFEMDKSSYSTMDDWLLVQNIENIKKQI